MNRPSNNGFTIIELLLVITIVSVLFVGVMSTYIQIQKLLTSQRETSHQGKEAEDLYRVLNQDLQNLVYESWNAKYFFNSEKEIINGHRIDFLNFISGSIYSNPGVLQSRVRNIAYFGQIDNETGGVILYRKEDMFADYERHTLGVPVPVLTKITEFRAEFSRTGNDWVDKWDISQMKTLPQFIKITITYRQNSDLAVPEKTLVLETTPGILM